jgi:uncharacterized membrane-anchored protein YhcB (DUF1043 family)
MLFAFLTALVASVFGPLSTFYIWRMKNKAQKVVESQRTLVANQVAIAEKVEDAATKAETVRTVLAEHTERTADNIDDIKTSLAAQDKVMSQQGKDLKAVEIHTNGLVEQLRKRADEDGFKRGQETKPPPEAFHG